MLNVKTVAEVNALVSESFGGLRMPTEQVPLAEALGRVTAQDILSQEFVPNFNRATVDGYAVIASDVFGCTDAIPALLTLAGESRMGEPATITLQQGQCAYVPTGAELPANADAMVMLEHAEDFGGGTIAINKPVAPGANLIFRGDDVKPGQTVIPAGSLLSAAEIGTLAAMGVSRLAVVRKPLAGIISTGDELVPAGQPLAGGQIRDVNAPMLAAAVRQCGGEAHFVGIIKDNQSAIRAALESALPGCDLLLLSGGTSVGVKDAMPAVISALGELLVHGVAAKPGKPTILGVIQNKPVFGLPGNPVAAYFMFHMLVRPLIYSMLGAQPAERRLTLPLTRAVSSNHGREEFVPVAITPNGAQPIASKSGLISTLACAQGFIRIPRDCEGLPQGEPVEVILFER
ncbi:MAG: molybdopterin molybdotransferase MoeA [Anaerolineae bacterium]|nr:molybdopterin molybdotransferase MoeA [Anaerolineae bacterium]